VGLNFIVRVLVFLFLTSTGIAQGLSRNDVIRAAELSAPIEAARARLKLAQTQASAAGLPISANLGGAYSVAGNSSTTGTITNDIWKLNLNLSFGGLFGPVLETRMLADFNFERAKRALIAAQIKSTRNAVVLWHAMRHGFLALELTNLSLETAKLADQAAEARFQAGGISINERENASLALERADLDVQKVKLQLQSAQLQLEINFAVKAKVISQTWQALPEPGETMQLESREDVFEARASLRLAEFERSKANQAALPSAKLEAGVSGSSGSLSFSVNQNLASTVTYSFSNAPIASTDFSVGVSMSVPLDFANWNALGSMTDRVHIAQNNLDLVLSSAKADVISHRAALGLSGSSLELAQHSLEFEEKQFQRIKTRFENGLVNPLEYQKAQLQVLKNHLDLFDAEAELDLSVIDVHQATASTLEVPQ
jgi:outer membrane protein TolC